MVLYNLPSVLPFCRCPGSVEHCAHRVCASTGKCIDVKRIISFKTKQSSAAHVLSACELLLHYLDHNHYSTILSAHTDPVRFLSCSCVYPQEACFFFCVAFGFF